MEQALPQAQLSVIERCGHLPQLEHPQATADKIRSFIKEGDHVKFFAFHLMPYRHLDFAKADAYRSYWVVLPNSHYDPKKAHGFIRNISTSSSLPRRSASTASASTSIIRPPTG